MNNNLKINQKELQSILVLSIIFALRMFGVFMVLPILTIYAETLIGSNKYLIGCSIGIYGIMQIILQLPFGVISDKIGRKPIIIVGLIISTIGSEIAAITDRIWGLIIGRALQGSGAVGSVLITLLLISVREQYRTQAMASIGVSAGITFMSSIILGPFLVNEFGLHGLFHIISIITILAIILMYFTIPDINSNINYDINLTKIIHNIKSIITNSKLLKLNFSIFCLHSILILNFMVWPEIIISLGYDPDIHFKLYAVIVFISILITLLCMCYLNIKNYKKKILNIFINILFFSEFIMFITMNNHWLFILGMQLFFISFNIIELILPTLINKESPYKYQGTSISIYSTFQFLGIGLGGILGGFLLKIQGIWLVFLCALIIITINIITNDTLRKSF